MNHGSAVNAFWTGLGVPAEKVNARSRSDRATRSDMVDGLPVGYVVDQRDLMRRTNDAIARYKLNNPYRDDPEMRR